MAKLKLTKSELKNQRDALKRFTRYLPTLQLKKQQLQLEVRRVREELKNLVDEEDQARSQLKTWVGLIAADHREALASFTQVEKLEVVYRNIAGIDTPVFGSIAWEKIDYDLFLTPMWYDDAIHAVRNLTEFRIKHRLLEEQSNLLEQELRTTTQRVNLFEKVKIPEAVDNIRKIQIYLGDQQANAVGRAKIAKGKAEARAVDVAEI